MLPFAFFRARRMPEGDGDVRIEEIDGKGKFLADAAAVE